ncbi:MAG: SDR family oxidoreductase [Proteobacteria bacterium]|nr:SDR family oxidoreductase [Pseudomonadota bacterium]
MTHPVRTTALITGASSGIGAIYADRLARRGHDLILVARDPVRLTAVAEAATRHSVAVETIRADLADPADLRRIEARLREDPAITMLVNNAGIGTPPGLAGADPDALERMIKVNVTAPTRLATAAASAFAAAGRGTIVNISSVLALAPELFSGVYSGTKAFVLNLSLSMRNELAGRGVRVQAVLPGATRTAFWDSAGGSADALPAEMVMAAEEMVDAALAGLDAGEDVTIPSLPERADWDAFNAARAKLGPNLSRQHAAARYRSVDA